MYQSKNGIVRFAPLFIHSFRLIAPRKLLEAQQFNRRYHSYEEISSVPDRLRWCRHQQGWMQKEVAERIGITREQYISYENGGVDYYPKKIVDKLAALYQIPVEDLLDDYNLFLYAGQGKLIREYRESLGMKKRPFARMLGIFPRNLQLWETEQKRVSKNSWQKYFSDVIFRKN
jgi:DNA-binding XRE family transcriptional regulator